MELLQTTGVSKTSSGHNKSRDSISTQNNDLDDSVSLTENEPPLKKKTLKTIITERKLELLTRFVESMAPGSSAKQPTHFALLVE